MGWAGSLAGIVEEERPLRMDARWTTPPTRPHLTIEPMSWQFDEPSTKSWKITVHDDVVSGWISLVMAVIGFLQNRQIWKGFDRAKGVPDSLQLQGRARAWARAWSPDAKESLHRHGSSSGRPQDPR